MWAMGIATGDGCSSGERERNRRGECRHSVFRGFFYVCLGLSHLFAWYYRSIKVLYRHSNEVVSYFQGPQKFPGSFLQPR